VTRQAVGGRSDGGTLHTPLLAGSQSHGQFLCYCCLHAQGKGSRHQDRKPMLQPAVTVRGTECQLPSNTSVHYKVKHHATGLLFAVLILFYILPTHDIYLIHTYSTDPLNI
jgi:hypothetical protein